MPAILKNESMQPVVLVLDHAAFANKDDGWTRSTARFATVDEQGRRVVSEVRRSYPGSLTILPGESSDPMHDAVVNCAQVPSLLAQRILSVSYEEDAPKDKPADEPEDKPADKPVVTSRIQTKASEA